MVTGNAKVFYSQAAIAEVLGVSRSAINNWVNRYSDFPHADGTMVGPTSGRITTPMYSREQAKAVYEWYLQGLEHQIERRKAKRTQTERDQVALGQLKTTGIRIRQAIRAL